MPSTLVEAEFLDVFKVELAKQKIPIIINYLLEAHPTFNHSFSICRALYVGSVSVIQSRLAGYLEQRVSLPGRGRSTLYPLTIFIVIHIITLLQF